ncbi:hypothetical protein EXIGLDRAFT_722032 [Exidia glandulosa HHB12029]|uniref:F-box domain-containing protein n=1 Tax=Exidia glandulosa HHB12029 TaxID=1314781 RepID=A0A165FIG1_EXIGL|nr:hypothetical protein EXIGLDRAFT_722032 [Exidia glandulosa HHB12029]
MTSTRSLLQTLATFPLELLALIFEDACAVDVAAQQDGSVDLDWSAARCPYAIAGVCRRWREAALSTHAMWQHIAVSQQWVDAVDKAPFKRHLQDLLARSGSRVLDIRIAFQSDRHLEDDACARQNACFSYFFQSLYRSASRIRSLRVCRASAPYSRQARPDTLRTKLLQLLRCPTPQLETLDIQLDSWAREEDSEMWLGYPERVLPCFLPEAPTLRSMRISGVPVLLCRSTLALLALTYLSISHVSVPMVYLWDTLAAAPNLQYLELVFGSVIHDGRAATRLTALPITTLVTGGNALDQLALPTQVDFPHLSTLKVPNWAFDKFTVTDALARSVTSITVQFYETDPEDRAQTIANLRLFEAVESAELEYIDAIIEDEKFLFDALCDTVAPMWPKLRLFRLEGLEDYGLGDVERGGLLRLVQNRNVSRTPVAEGDEDNMPVPIESLEFDAKSVPLWISIRVAGILGDKCRLIDS